VHQGKWDASLRQEDGAPQEPKEEEEERAEARPPVERLAECGEKLVLMQYAEREGSWVEVGRVNAPKQAVMECPWAVKVDDLDFATQKSFLIWGSLRSPLRGSSSTYGSGGTGSASGIC
jgi:hypothetical protein